MHAHKKRNFVFFVKHWGVMKSAALKSEGSKIRHLQRLFGIQGLQELWRSQILIQGCPDCYKCAFIKNSRINTIWTELNDVNNGLNVSYSDYDLSSRAFNDLTHVPEFFHLPDYSVIQIPTLFWQITLDSFAFNYIIL